MKKSLVILFACALLCLCLSLPAQEEEVQDFTIVNETGVSIDELYISAVSTNNWEEDVLGVDVLADSESTDITFDVSEEECKWDIMIKDEEGKEYFWRGVNLCKITTLTLHYEGDKAWATAE